MTETSFAKWRAKVGMTQAEAAKALGVSLTTIKQYEGGKHLSTGKKMSPPEPVRKLMRAIANGIRLEAWPE
jgi:DNA-binding XRE family transcriptional regulator